jgi:hypothetical protein
VRATAIDSNSYNFRTIVPRDGVFDRVRISHEVNLMDIDPAARGRGDVRRVSRLPAHAGAGHDRGGDAMSDFWPAPAVGPARDLVGYGRHLPKVRWPRGARVVVSLCLNYEEGSERTYAAGDNVNENSGESGRAFPPGVRNLAMESNFEYGSRAGIHRLLRMFDDLGVPCTAFAAAVALACNREVADWMVASGHEICSHGWRWSEQWTMSRDEEAERIGKAVALFEQVCGVRPQGWYKPLRPQYQHPRAAGRGRLPVRQRRIQRRFALLHAGEGEGAPGHSLQHDLQRRPLSQRALRRSGWLPAPAAPRVSTNYYLGRRRSATHPKK